MILHTLSTVVKSVSFYDILTVLIFSLIGAHYIVAHAEPYSLWQLLHAKPYYLAMIGSFAIALIITSLVFLTSAYLDVKFPWLLCFGKRLTYQFLVCTVGYSLLSFALAGIYFKLRGISIFDTRYLKNDFPVVIILLCFLNVFYAAKYAFKQLKVYTNPPVAQFEELYELTTAHAEEETGEPLVPNFNADHIAYFFHKHKTNWEVDFAGQLTVTNLLMEQIYQHLPQGDFFKLQKGFIINRKAITATTNASSRRLIVYLDTPCNKELNVVSVSGKLINSILVPQRQVKAFLAWY